MAEREVKIKVSAEDDTAKGLSSAERRLKRLEEQEKKRLERIRRDSLGVFRRVGEDSGTAITNSIAKTFNNLGAGLSKIGIKAGRDIGTSLAAGAQAASPQLQSAITVGLVGAAASAAPLIGATIAGAVVGSAAGVGIIGGVVLASRDARVSAAGTALGQSLLGSLSTQSSVFIAPLLDSIGQIQRRFASVQGQIGQGFAQAARFVAPLTDAILDAGESVLTGLVAALQKAGPVVTAVGEGIRTLGRITEYALVSFASVGDEGALAFRDLFTVIELVSKQIIFMITALAKAYGFVRTLGGLIGDTSEETKGLGDVATTTAEGMLPFQLGLEATGTAAAGAADSVSNLAGAQQDLIGATIGLAEAQINTERAFKDAKDVIDGTTTATLDEKAAILDLVGVTNSEIEAMRAKGVAASEVNARSNELRESLIRQAQASGYSRKAAEELINSYGLFPKVVNTDVKLSGAEQARRELERTRAVAGSIPDQINIAIRVTGSEASRQAIQSALAKQSMMADAGAAYVQDQAAFAAGSNRAGVLAGARDRQPPIRLSSDVRVNLDGRAIAPMVTTVAKTLDKRVAWRERRAKR